MVEPILSIGRIVACLLDAPLQQYTWRLRLVVAIERAARLLADRGAVWPSGLLRLQPVAGKHECQISDP